MLGTRLKILVFGACKLFCPCFVSLYIATFFLSIVSFNCYFVLYAVSSDCSTPDIGLFGTDVITDWVNGSNLIKRGDVIWGGIMVALPFLPMTIYLLFLAFAGLADKKGWWVGLLLLLFLLPLAALATPAYMGFILLAGLVRLVNPQIGDDDEVLGGLLDGDHVKWLSPLLRMVEVVGESYPQAILGESSLTCLIQHHCSQLSLSSSSCLLYTSPSPRDVEESRMPSYA